MLACSGEHPHHVGALQILRFEPLVRVVRPDLARPFSRSSVTAGSFKASVDDAVELCVHRVGVGLVVDRVQRALTQDHDDFGVAHIRFGA